MRRTDITAVVQIVHDKQHGIRTGSNLAACIGHQIRGGYVDVMVCDERTVTPVLQVSGVQIDIILAGDRAAVGQVCQLKIHLISGNVTAVVELTTVHLQRQATASRDGTAVLHRAAIVIPAIRTDG